MTPMMHVLVIGAGGLGGPIAYALAAAHTALTVCDDDVVELSNLQRQIQFSSADIGRPKAQALADELVRHGHDRASITAVAERFNGQSAATLLAGVDLVIDASDDFATKFEVNDRALAHGLPVVIASALHYTGQIFALDPRAAESREQGCYRCLFEAPPTGQEVDGQNCALAGVLGATVGFIGGLAADAALCLLSGESLFATGTRGGLWLVDDVRRATRALPTRVCHYGIRADCPACRGRGATTHTSIEDNHPGEAEPWLSSVSPHH